MLGTATLSAGKATYSTSSWPWAAIRSRPPTWARPALAASASSNSSDTITAAVSNPDHDLAGRLGQSAVAGQTVTFTATVAATSSNTIATGTVTFKDGSTVLGTATLNAGKATYSTSALAAGSHAITASYSGTPTSPPAPAAACPSKSTRSRLPPCLSRRLLPRPSASGSASWQRCGSFPRPLDPHRHGDL